MIEQAQTQMDFVDECEGFEKNRPSRLYDISKITQEVRSLLVGILITVFSLMPGKDAEGKDYDDRGYGVLSSSIMPRGKRDRIKGCIFEEKDGASLQYKDRKYTFALSYWTHSSSECNEINNIGIELDNIDIRARNFSPRSSSVPEPILCAKEAVQKTLARVFNKNTFESYIGNDLVELYVGPHITPLAYDSDEWPFGRAKPQDKLFLQDMGGAYYVGTSYTDPYKLTVGIYLVNPEKKPASIFCTSSIFGIEQGRESAFWHEVGYMYYDSDHKRWADNARTLLYNRSRVNELGHKAIIGGLGDFTDADRQRAKNVREGRREDYDPEEKRRTDRRDVCTSKCLHEYGTCMRVSKPECCGQSFWCGTCPTWCEGEKATCLANCY